MDIRNIGVVLIAFTVQIAAVSVNEGYPVTVMCPLDDSITFPTWTGPDTLAKPLMTGTSFNEPEIQWEANNHDIKITKAMLKHEGTYTCSSSNGLTKEVNLTVNYFVRPQMDLKTESNGKTTLTCGAYSKPELQIPVHVKSSGNTDASNKTTRITFNGCKPDPNYNNRNYCDVTAIWYIAKQDNGMEQECPFVHNGVERARLTKRVYFNFPPTVVTITGNKPITGGPTLNLTCSTDSSYPVSTLVWKTNNEVTQNDAELIVMDAKYNGKSISQILSLMVSNDMNGQQVSCCVRDLCDSVTLNINITSAGVTATAWTTLMLACLLLITYLYN